MKLVKRFCKKKLAEDQEYDTTKNVSESQNKDEMTKEFIDSQVEHYRKNLKCGHSRDWNQIHGLYQYYTKLQREFTDEKN